MSFMSGWSPDIMLRLLLKDAEGNAHLVRGEDGVPGLPPFNDERFIPAARKAGELLALIDPFEKLDMDKGGKLPTTWANPAQYWSLGSNQFLDEWRDKSAARFRQQKLQDFRQHMRDYHPGVSGAGGCDCGRPPKVDMSRLRKAFDSRRLYYAYELMIILRKNTCMLPLPLRRSLRRNGPSGSLLGATGGRTGGGSRTCPTDRKSVV